MDEERWDLETPMSDNELQHMKDIFGNQAGDCRCTCSGCSRERICVFYWDAWNVDNECMMLK